MDAFPEPVARSRPRAESMVEIETSRTRLRVATTTSLRPGCYRIGASGKLGETVVIR